MAFRTDTGAPRLRRIARFLVEAERGTRNTPMTMQMQLRRPLTAIGLPVASARKSINGGVFSVAGSAMSSWSSTQGIVPTLVTEAQYCITQRSKAQQKHLAVNRWQGTVATISKSSSGVAPLLSDACGSLERLGQPYSTHGGEVLVSPGSTADTTVRWEKARV